MFCMQEFNNNVHCYELLNLFLVHGRIFLRQLPVQGYDVFIVDSTVGSLCVYDSRKDKWLPYTYECPCSDFQPAIVRDTLILVSNGIPGNTTSIYTLDLTRNRLWDNAYASIPMRVSNPKVASAAPYLIIASTMPNAAHVYILNMHSEKWHVCDKHCLSSWISSISAMQLMVKLCTLYHIKVQ